MKRALTLLPVLLMVGLLAGCSDDDLSPTDPGDETPATVETTDNGDGTFTTVVDAGYLDATEFVYFSFATGDQVERAEGDPWDLAFKFANIIQNGGANGDGGVCLYAFDDDGFDALTAAPEGVYLTDGGEDDPGQAFNVGGGWYTYSGSPDHVFSVNESRYYAIRLSDGSFVKLRMDGFADDAGTPGYPTFTWSVIAGDFAVMTAMLAPAGGNETTVAAGSFGSQDWVYLDLSSGLQATPADPSDDAGWDLAFKSVDIAVNGGITGTGGVEIAIFDDTDYATRAQAPASGYITDETDAQAFDQGSGWYTYTGPPDHLILTHADHYYVVRDAAGDYYKLRMVTFYNSAEESGYPSFEWEGIAAP